MKFNECNGVGYDKGGKKLPFLSVTIYQQDYYRNVLSETGMTRYV